jgi:hypothetical protein
MSVAPNINSDAREFIAENAFQTAYWADVAREATTICDDALLAYATRKATAYARAFAGAAKDMLLANEGSSR